MTLGRAAARKAIPDSQSLELIERIGARFPSQRPLILLIKHLAFDKEDTIPHDYLWHPRTAQKEGGGRLGGKVCLEGDGLEGPHPTIISAQEKDCGLISELVDIESKLSCLLEEGAPASIQSLLFEYGKVSRARKEHVRAAYFQRIEDQRYAIHVQAGSDEDR